MRLFIAFVFLLVFHNILAQENVNISKGYGAEGYDLVAYFNKQALKGNKKFTTTYNEVKYIFSSSKNLSEFKKDPECFLPEYGGYCAYAIAVKGEKVSVNPKNFLIINKKLYLFYNSWGTNTLEKWNEEEPESLLLQANNKWKEIIK